MKSAMEQGQPKFRPSNTKLRSSALQLHAHLGQVVVLEGRAASVHCVNQGKTLPLFFC